MLWTSQRQSTVVLWALWKANTFFTGLKKSLLFHSFSFIISFYLIGICPQCFIAHILTGLVIQQVHSAFILILSLCWVIQHKSLYFCWKLLWHWNSTGAACLSESQTCLFSGGSYKLRHVTVVWPQVMGKPNPAFQWHLKDNTTLSL